MTTVLLFGNRKLTEAMNNDVRVSRTHGSEYLPASTLRQTYALGIAAVYTARR